MRGRCFWICAAGLENKGGDFASPVLVKANENTSKSKSTQAHTFIIDAGNGTPLRLSLTDAQLRLHGGVVKLHRAIRACGFRWAVKVTPTTAGGNGCWWVLYERDSAA